MVNGREPTPFTWNGMERKHHFFFTPTVESSYLLLQLLPTLSKCEKVHVNSPGYYATNEASH